MLILTPEQHEILRSMLICEIKKCDVQFTSVTNESPFAFLIRDGKAIVNNQWAQSVVERERQEIEDFFRKGSFSKGELAHE